MLSFSHLLFPIKKFPHLIFDKSRVAETCLVRTFKNLLLSSILLLWARTLSPLYLLALGHWRRGTGPRVVFSGKLCWHWKTQLLSAQQVVWWSQKCYWGGVSAVTAMTGCSFACVTQIVSWEGGTISSQALPFPLVPFLLQKHLQHLLVLSGCFCSCQSL